MRLSGAHAADHGSRGAVAAQTPQHVVSFLERAATLPVRARVPSAHRQGSPSRLSPSRTSCRSGDRWAITLAEYCYVMYLNEEYDAAIDGG